MAKITVEYSKSDVLDLILADLRSKMPDAIFIQNDIKFEVITRQNYRSAEWERGDFRATVDGK